jgi:cytochrome P450
MASSSSIRYSAQDVRSIPKASFFDKLAIVRDVLLPTLAKGVIVRRPTVMAFAERFDLDRRAIRRMQRIRNKYKSGPLVFRFSGRSLALILDPEHVHRVLEGSPEPFATASSEKGAALAHFEPRNVLISHGSERAERRHYNENVLDSNRPVHRLAKSFLNVVDSEAMYLCENVRHHGELNWEEFSRAWFRIARRVLFGDATREDHQLSKIMFQLRSAANWAFLRPQRKDMRQQLLDRIHSYLSRADPDSLAGVMAQTHATSRTAPEQQVPQWLFAFDPAGMTTFRTLALLASHLEYARHVREEIGSAHGVSREYMPYSRAAVLESLRLWPTTPFVLRESTAATAWETGILPANTEILIFTPFFHRDDQRLSYADQFSPELWRNTQPQGWPLIPFSEGPAACPGRNLVLFLSTAMLAAILDRARVRLKHPTRLMAGQPLPATLNHFGLRFELKGLC